MSEHYFSADPASDETYRTIVVPLAGKQREVVTASGTFSHDALDTGTSVLLDAVPAPPRRGNLLDLGCGWGPIALTLALLAPEARVWAIDVNTRALDSVRRNAESLRLPGITAVAPEAVPDVRFDAIWSNPPIRIGKPALHGLLERWIPRLNPNATAWLVVQKHLGSDSLERWLREHFPAFDIERATSKKTFRVLAVTAPSEGAESDRREG